MPAHSAATFPPCVQRFLLDRVLSCELLFFASSAPLWKQIWAVNTVRTTEKAIALLFPLLLADVDLSWRFLLSSWPSLRVVATTRCCALSHSYNYVLLLTCR
ncbi:hypothetical protein KP509_19G005200 [Ceratopteris richardii]|uniref:Uncharacterized protein n=1 Tax=Ceratopteris richardii TaxID=49495 RepID=A0A8T2SHR4_CERRI|nr:hypothetical protein KP509_19G005200 [Ceratopteris richardii]